MNMAHQRYEENRLDILHCLEKHGPITNKDVARYTGLQWKTCANVMGRLHLDGYVHVIRVSTANARTWARTPKPYVGVTCHPRIAEAGKVADTEHMAWMAYWRQRWDARQERRHD